MEINYNGKELELSFGLGFLNEVDRELGFEVEQMSIGQDLNMLIPNLQQGNPVALSKVIKAATSHYKKSPKTFDELEVVVTEIAENEGIEEFSEQIVKELGKRVLIRNLVPDEYKETKKKTK